MVSSSITGLFFAAAFFCSRALRAAWATDWDWSLWDCAGTGVEAAEAKTKNEPSHRVWVGRVREVFIGFFLPGRKRRIRPRGTIGNRTNGQGGQNGKSGVMQTSAGVPVWLYWSRSFIFWNSQPWKTPRWFAPLLTLFLYGFISFSCLYREVTRRRNRKPPRPRKRVHPQRLRARRYIHFGMGRTLGCF